MKMAIGYTKMTKSSASMDLVRDIPISGIPMRLDREVRVSSTFTQYRSVSLHILIAFIMLAGK